MPKIRRISIIGIPLQKWRTVSFRLCHETQDSKEPFLKRRHVTAFIGFLIFSLLSINRTVMSVAIVAMVNSTAIRHMSEAGSDSCPSLIMNVTEDEKLREIKKEGAFVWSSYIQGYVLGSYFVGYVVTQLPTGVLAERYGCKWFLFSASLITGVLTLLIPPIAYLSVSAVIAIQIMRGLSQGLIQPSMAILGSNWFPKSERGFLYAFMGSATSLGTAFGSILTGYLCELIGWPYSFYAVGIAGVTLSLSIAFMIFENPNAHPNISKAELAFILSNQECILRQKRPKRPWRSMLTSIPVYAFLFGYAGHVWAVSQFWTVQSTFLGTILHYPIAENGVFTAIPFLLQFFFCQFGAWISLYIQNNNIFSVDCLRKFWTFISGSLFSGCLLGMYFAGCNRALSIIFSVLSMGFIGLGMPGIAVVATDMTPTFAGSLHALICTISYLTTFILPVIVGYLTDKMQTIEQWNKVFFISIGVVTVTKIVFILFGSAEVQPWNFVEENVQCEAEKRTKDNKIDLNSGKIFEDKNDGVTRF